MELQSFTRHESVGVFVFEGAIALPALIEAYRDAHESCREHGLRGAVIDLSRAEGTLEATGRAELVATLAGELTREILIATVLNAGQYLPTRFGELMAQNRGFRTREFMSRADALAWLSSALAPPTPDAHGDLD